MTLINTCFVCLNIILKTNDLLKIVMLDFKILCAHMLLNKVM